MPRTNKGFMFLMGAAVFFAGGCCRTAGIDTCNKQGRMLRHVVLIKFKEATTEEQKRETEEIFCEMARRIEDIEDFEWGTNVSESERTEGFTHCFVLTFASEAGLDRYMVDARHEKARAATMHYIEKILVIDYWKRKN